MMRDYIFWIAMCASFAATVACWLRILRSDDPTWFKATVVAIAAVPFIGPLFYLFIDLPPSLPEDAMAKGTWMRGTTVRGQITRELSDGYRRYLNKLYGVGAPNKAGKRRERRK